MRLRFFPLAALALIGTSVHAQTPSATADPTLAQTYQATITPAELAGHLYVYADDYMAGRETGEPGQRFAARYLAGEYQTMGILPKGTGSSDSPYNLDGYLQPFELEQKALRRLSVTATRGGTAFLESTVGPDDTDDLVLAPAYGSLNDASPARLVFVGDATDLSGVDVEDAIALMIPGDGGRAALQAGAAALREAGARAVVIATEPEVASLAPVAARAFRGGRLTLPPRGGADDEAGGLPPLLFTGIDVADRLLEGVDRSAPGDTGVMLAVDADMETTTVETENVVAMIEGSDPVLKNEFVVISAHLDHIGVGTPNGDEDVINNGADDDGSGTISLLEIAEAFQTAKEDGHGPRRSILFLHVTGEEKGLLGSEYFADYEPLVPLENVAADLNIDMIGRHDPERGFERTDYVYIIGADLISQDIADWNASVNDVTGTGLLLSDRFNSPDDPNQFFRRSDHWNFGKHQIPFIFYFTGTHEDYHRVGDSPDKIDYDRMARIARLVFGTAWEIANTDIRPAVSGVGFN